MKLNVRFLEKCVLEDEDFVTRVFGRAEQVTFLPVQLYYYYAENKSGLSNIPDPAHQSRLMHDRLMVITGLKRMREAICDPQLEEGLDRKLSDLAVDTIRILISKPYDEEQISAALDTLSKLSRKASMGVPITVCAGQPIRLVRFCAGNAVAPPGCGVAGQAGSSICGWVNCRMFLGWNDRHGFVAKKMSIMNNKSEKSLHLSRNRFSRVGTIIFLYVVI